MKKIIFNFKIIASGAYKSYLLLWATILIVFGACKKQLNVNDPNDPNFGVNVTSESGITAFAKGGVYWNGFNYGDAWLGDSYFSLPWGYHELMGDVIGGGQGSNNQTTTMGVPDKIQGDPNDPSTITVNGSPQASGIIRAFNNRAATTSGNNALYYEWTNMYAMINNCNLVLEQVDGIPLTADKTNTVKAWAYWWKGYAYAQIGTLYYAGIIVNHSNTTVSHYLGQDSLIAESNRNLNLALTTLNSITNQGDYNTVIAELIPTQCQVGLGLPPSSAQWARSINTLLARNILLNKLSPFVNGNPDATISNSSIPVISAEDWQSIITLCNSGLQQGDYVFTGRTSASNSFFSPNGGSVAGICTASNQTTTYKVSERIVQEFKPGDARLANFTTSGGTFYGGVSNSTRYSLVDGVDAGFTSIPVLGSRAVGGLEIYIGPTYEENALTLAEAKIRTGDIEGGLHLVDQVRASQGSGVAAVAGHSLTLPQALKELTMERLAALTFRGLSFYDSRRWGWTYSLADGGGRYGCTVIFNSTVYTNGIIDYNFMDYWDVPADETDLNAPDGSSAPVVNKNY